MRKITIDKLEEGMVLAKPLMRGNMVILGEGTVLNESWISRIEDMDTTHLFVEGAAEQVIPKEEALDQLETRFKLVENQPDMQSLKNLVKEHIEGLYDG